MVGAAIVPGSEVLLHGRRGESDAHRRHRNPAAHGRGHRTDEPALVRRRAGGGPARARPGAASGIAIDQALVASAIDEFPVVFIAAACAQGVDHGQRCRGVARQGKSTASRPCATGCAPSAFQRRPGPMARASAAACYARRNSRLARAIIASPCAFAMAALRAEEPHRDPATAPTSNTSFPGFAELARDGGLANRRAVMTRRP